MAHFDANDHLGGYESYEQRIRPILAFVAVLAAATLAILGLMKLVHSRLTGESGSTSQPPHALAEAREIPPDPRLQDAPARDLALLREHEASRLSQYGWVDREKGVVRIPIERAMELVAEEGLPARGKGGR